MSACGAYERHANNQCGHSSHDDKSTPLETISRHFSHCTPYERNPILYAPREGADYVTCWSCRNGYPLVCAEHDSLASDAVWCCKYDELIDSPHEHRTGADAECWLPL